MPKVQIVTLDTARLVEEPAGSKGKIISHAFFDRERDSLHMHLHELQPGAKLEIDGSEHDDVVYIWRGAATAGDTRLEPRASMIVEKGASAEVTAAEEGASVLVFNMNGRPAQPREGGHVYLLPSERVPRVLDMGGGGVAGGALHADAACPSSEVWLHENDFYQEGYEVAVHSHTEDEIIFVRDGNIKLGNRLFGPGTTLAIAANTKYGFHAGPGGLSFVNFRATSPCHVSADGSHVMDEAKLWHDFVGKPEYLELTAA